MARGVHEVIFGGGAQDLVHVPPARVTSATVAIEDLTKDDEADDRFVVASAAATLDSYDITTTAVSGAGQADPRLMTHAGSAATAGRAYAIESSDARYELFEAEGVAATTIRARGPLSGVYASGSHVRGVQLSVAFPALAAADEDLFDGDPPLRVRWTYTISGQLWRVDELVRLVRSRSFARSLAEVELSLRTSWPELVKSVSPKGNALRDIVRGVASRLDARLRGQGVDPETALTGALGFELLLQRCVLHLGESGYAPSNRDVQLFVDEQAREFARLWQTTITGSTSRGAADVDRESDTAPRGSSKKTRNPFVRG